MYECDGCGKKEKRARDLKVRVYADEVDWRFCDWGCVVRMCADWKLCTIPRPRGLWGW